MLSVRCKSFFDFALTKILHALFKPIKIFDNLRRKRGRKHNLLFLLLVWNRSSDVTVTLYSI